MSASNPNVSAIQNIYSAFGQGDLPTVLEQIASDATWCNLYGQGIFPGSWGRPCRGHDQIAAFFKTIGETVDVHGFEPLEFIAERDTVVVKVRWNGVVRRTNTPFETLLVHLWTIRDGKVADYIGLDDPTAYSF